MRKSFGAKPFIYPMPVFIIASYDENNTANAMNAAWGGIANYKIITMYLDAHHKTVQNILKTKAFTVSMATEDQMVASDYVGLVSGNKEPNKLEKTGWHTTRSELVNAPIIEELPLALECRLKSFDENTHLLVGEIVNVSAKEEILGEDGKIDPMKLKPIIFDPVHNDYLTLGKKVGNAFKDGNQLK